MVFVHVPPENFKKHIMEMMETVSYHSKNNLKKNVLFFCKWDFVFFIFLNSGAP